MNIVNFRAEVPHLLFSFALLLSSFHSIPLPCHSIPPPCHSERSEESQYLQKNIFTQIHLGTSSQLLRSQQLWTSCLSEGTFFSIIDRLKTPNCLHQNVKAFKAKHQGVFKKCLHLFWKVLQLFVNLDFSSNLKKLY